MKAGWGVCVTEKREDWTPTCIPIVQDELFGRVCEETGSINYAQVTTQSNNTAELTGLLQAIVYLERQSTAETEERHQTSYHMLR